MSETIANVIQDARQWVEQEQAWGTELFGTVEGKGGVPGTAANPVLPREEVLLTDTSRRPSGFAAVPGISRPSSPAKAAALQALYEKYNTCTLCPLGFSRLKFVFGVGSPEAEVMFIGEGPGYEEDHKGEPFIGKAGQLLDKMMEAIGLSRKVSYIANIVKCHAMVNPQTQEARGNDRAPTSVESETCSPILKQQIAIIQPKLLVTLGSPSSRSVLMTQEGITKIRGRLFPLPAAYLQDQAPSLTSIRVLPTYHPAALLRNPDLKKDAWEDMKLLRDTLKLSA